MARIRNMAAKTLSSLKKHWLKILVAVVVIYLIYSLFFQDDLEHFKKSDLDALKLKVADTKKLYDDAVKAEADVKAGKIPAPDCTDPYKAVKIPGCSDYTTAKYYVYKIVKGIYEEAYKEYKKSQKRKNSVNSRFRRFFGMK